MDLIEKAKKLATEAHFGQFRKWSGKPYIVHPEAVVDLLQEFISIIPEANRQNALAGAWLHDYYEDCLFGKFTLELLLSETNQQVFDIVVWLTNPSKKLDSLSREEKKNIDIQHLSQAPFLVKVIKCCDRICNLRDLTVEYQQGKVEEKYFNMYLMESIRLFDALKAVPFELRRLGYLLCNVEGDE